MRRIREEDIVDDRGGGDEIEKKRRIKSQQIFIFFDSKRIVSDRRKFIRTSFGSRQNISHFII